MARNSTIQATPSLTPNNHLYLYQLLSGELGCGKQTFLPAVEEALASDRMTAEDLGFESTRALLETLESFIKLTVFKGGRIYATVIAQPEWDAALQAAGAGKTSAEGKNDKPWKRKKANKALKPVRPKRVKRPEPKVEEEAEAKAEALVAEAKPGAETLAPKVKAEAEAHAEALEPKATPVTSANSTGSPVAHNTLTQQDSSIASKQALNDAYTKNAGTEQEEPALELTADKSSNNTAEDAIVSELDNAEVADCTPEPPTLEPAITFTVTYDPYSGIDQETIIESKPVVLPPTPKPEETPNTAAPKPTTAPEPAVEPNAVVEPKTAPAQKISQAPATKTASTNLNASAAAPIPTPAATSTVEVSFTQAEVSAPTPTLSASPSAEALASYPVDFATEVYLDSTLIAELCELLPYGTDVFALLAEDYTRALELKLISGTRARAVFPLRIAHIDNTKPLSITLKKRSGAGLKWELSKVE